MNDLEMEKMKVEIWSDVMCPFCYIGKRKFEAALENFESRNEVEVVWKSFQLNPALKTNPSKSVVSHLAESKGWTMEYANNSVNYVTEMAKNVGLDYHFEKAVVANSFDAQRLVHMAKQKGKSDLAEELLFKAYFTEGKNTADHDTLAELGTKIGLDAAEVKKMLEGPDFKSEVNNDILEAEQIGVSGVPFFVIDRKYAVSGAQDPSVFLNALTKAWKDNAERENSSRSFAAKQTSNGTSCDVDGECN
jgi:predicted DsbA family dithiol-disulfide isomerase